MLTIAGSFAQYPKEYSRARKKSVREMVFNGFLPEVMNLLKMCLLEERI